MKEFLFRLLKQNNIVGYLRYISPKLSFYSIDMYGWSAKKIDYDDKDHALPLKDKNQKVLFENDLFKHQHYPDSVFVCGKVEFDESYTIYQFCDGELIKSTLNFSQESFSSLTFYAYLKDNPELDNMINALD